MSQIPVLNFRDFISADGEQLTTDSLRVASAHGKRHDDVLRAIRRRVVEAGDWGARNFAETLYVNQQNGQSYPMFTMTKDGYTFLVQKFAGKKAVRFQLAYIEAFNAMEAYIRNQREGLSYRKAKHELECKDSERRGSFHGKGLNERRQELQRLDAEELLLQSLSQPSLLPN